MEKRNLSSRSSVTEAGRWYMNAYNANYDNKDIDAILNIYGKDSTNNNTDSEISYNRGITRRHWQKTSPTSCSNVQCNKKFGLLIRISHCRRCGLVFCKECVSFQRKLDRLANPDPDGKLYKVCQTCFDKGTQEMGATRNRWSSFNGLKHSHKKMVEASQTKRGWRNRFDLRQECNRLTTGFSKLINASSEVGRAIRELGSVVSVPEWQRAQNWPQEALCSRCGYCDKLFTLFTRQHHCRVCGISVCATCSSRDLIVYIPDPDLELSIRGDDIREEAKLAVIKVIGSPTIEPTLCVYLRVCKGCVQRLIDMQVTSHMTTDAPNPLITQISEKHEGLMKMREKIELHMIEYQKIIDSLDDNTRTSLSEDGSSRCNMKVLAKAQIDLSDFFTQYIVSLQHMKQFKPMAKSPTQTRLVNNFLKSICDFYMENVCTFRQHQKSLHEVCHPDILKKIQRIIDKDAITSAHIYLRQIVYEILHLTSKHAILQELPELLVPIEAEIEKEAELCILDEGDDWSEHQEVVQQLVQSQVQNHRLIRPSRRLTASIGVSHVRDVTLNRTVDVLLQIHVQLCMKTTDKNFPMSKSTLLKAYEEVFNRVSKK